MDSLDLVVLKNSEILTADKCVRRATRSRGELALILNQQATNQHQTYPTESLKMQWKCYIWDSHLTAMITENIHSFTHSDKAMKEGYPAIKPPKQTI